MWGGATDAGGIAAIFSSTRGFAVRLGRFETPFWQGKEAYFVQ
jgi:hypothetical protein